MAKKSVSKNPAAPIQARDLLQKLRELQQAVPGFAQPAGDQKTSVLRPNASLPNEFLEAASVAVDSSAALRTATQFDSDEVRGAIDFSHSFESVADEAEAFAKAIRHTIALRRAKAATDALQVYDVAKGLARKPEGANLVSHIHDMRRTLGRSGRKRKAPPAPPAQS